ncbi:OmpA family protein [Pedobacter sp.]|uniref:OmpA family protein n=1 Tax=Pedobacter sp. TaxID=1411316 RepID=UPI003D7FCF86
MKSTKALVLPALMVAMSLSMYSCKTKKIAAKPAPAPVAQQTPAPTPPPAPVTPPAPQELAPVKANYDFSTILFEFNSAVLKTASFQVLDQVVAEMKKDSSKKFDLNGHSSAEGSPEHNLSLSVDRANSVKSFLVNAGIDAANLEINGFGEKVPAASNDTEEARMQNRRVEIKVK